MKQTLNIKAYPNTSEKTRMEKNKKLPSSPLGKAQTKIECNIYLSRLQRILEMRNNLSPIVTVTLIGKLKISYHGVRN